MSNYKVTTKRKVLVLEWLEDKTLPNTYSYELLESAAEEKFEKIPMPFPIPHNEFEHIIEHLADLDLVNYRLEGTRRFLKIKTAGQDYLRDQRENGFWRRLTSNLTDKLIGAAVGIGALLIGQYFLKALEIAK